MHYLHAQKPPDALGGGGSVRGRRVGGLSYILISKLYTFITTGRGNLFTIFLNFAKILSK